MRSHWQARCLTIWSNDRDLSGLDIDCYSTARLLRVLSEQNDFRSRALKLTCRFSWMSRIALTVFVRMISC